MKKGELKQKTVFIIQSLEWSAMYVEKPMSLKYKNNSSIIKTHTD